MLKSLKSGISKRLMLLSAAVMALAPGAAFAGDASAGASAAQSIIEAQITGLTSAATPIITGALGVAALFFAAKFLWTKFKSIAR